jgi:hypothetical protein
MTFCTTRLLLLASLLATSACAGSVETSAPACGFDPHVTAFTSGWSEFSEALADHTDLPQALDGSADGWHPAGDFNLFLTSSAPMDIRGVHLEVLSGAVSSGGYVVLWGEADSGEYVLSGTMEAPTPIATADLAFRQDLADNLALWNRTALRVLVMAPEGTDPVVKIEPLCE